jgi:predicted  nucleic acid-binding Zn-ribbon protein
MKFFKKKEKGNNSVKELLKKLKRHDTKVVAIAVIIALILSGGLIYISTPIVASTATEELAESEKQANQDTADKLGEIGEHLNKLDQAVNSNQESLNSISEKTGNAEESKTINETVTKLDSKLDSKLKEVHTNINGTTSQIDNLKSMIEKGEANNKEQMSKEFEEINSELSTVNSTVSNNFSSINKSVGDGFGDMKSYIDSAAAGINSKLDSVFQRVSNGKKQLVSTLLTFGVSVKEDATFGDIDTGIKELGNRMLDAERKTENAERSVTPEKVMAGQTVIVNDKEIVGTATSDATASAEHILAGETAYVNGEMVIGTMPNHGSANIALSRENNTQTLEGGYYDSITVTADVSLLPANITYTHHVHSNGSTDERVVDGSFSSGSAYGSETSSSSGGCFGQPIYGPCGGSGVATSVDYGGYYFDVDGDGVLDQNIFYVGNCTSCGGGIQASGIGEVGKCQNQRVIGYRASCGRVAGQVIAAEVTY